MDRRKFLRGLLALPFAPIIAKLSPQGIPINETVDLRVTEAYVPQGSDQTSITLLDWAKAQDRPLLPVVEALSQRNHLLQDMVWKGPAPVGHKITMGGACPPRVNWLKRSIRG